jgi:phosphoglycolate phosphatase
VIRPYDLAIFDFDGTLADSFPFFLTVHNRLARKHGFAEVAEHEVEGLRGLATRELAARSGLPAWKLPIVARDFMAHMQAAEPVPLFAGVAEALREARARGLRLALVTSNSRENVSRTLGDSLVALFDPVDCGASMFGKASRLRRVLRRLGVDAARAIYVGDQTADGEAAQAAGMAFGAVAWGYATLAALEALRPARQFGSPSDWVGLADPGASHVVS